ncbi:MAG: CPBP family glutamic-type intramembrane protease [bacterium]
MGGVIDSEPAHRRFYLAAAILPTFTLVRLSLIGTLAPLSEEILSYLLLAATLVFYQHATQAATGRMSLRGPDIIRSLRDAIPLGFALAIAALILLPAPLSTVPEEAVFAILAAGAVALIDEYFFRGILQSQISAVSRPVVGWLATAFLFAAFAATTGDLTVIAYRAGLGLLLGFLVWWRGLLAHALMTRTVSVLLIGVLAPLDFSVLLPG